MTNHKFPSWEPIKTLKNITKTSELFIHFSIPEDYFGIIKEYPLIDVAFQKIHLKKKRGGFRVVINVRNETYIRLLRNIRDFLSSEFTFPYYVQGFIRSRGIFTNASCHLNKKIVINADIKDFFQSIKKEKILSIFLEIGFNQEVASLFTEIVTLKGEVPAGFCTSPVLANLIFREIDIQLNSFAESHGYTYTRYADDMTFSSDSSDYIISEQDLNLILETHGFLINNKKYKVQYRGNKQYVTGLTVCDKNSPRIPRKTKRNMRLELYYIKKYGIDGVRKNVFFGENFYNIMQGWFGYAIGIKEQSFVSLLKKYGLGIIANESKKSKENPPKMITKVTFIE